MLSLCFLGVKCELKREWWGGWKVNLFLLCADSRAGQDVTLCSETKKEAVAEKGVSEGQLQIWQGPGTH